MKKSEFREVNQCEARMDIADEIILFELHCENTVQVSNGVQDIIPNRIHKSLLSCLKLHMETCPSCAELENG